jgi:hypothetical protein
MRARTTNIAVAILLLVIGSAIYAVWRSRSLLMFQWFDAAGIAPLIDRIRAYFQLVQVPSWIRYSLPDALWGCSGVFLFSAIWAGSRSSLRYFWIFLAPCLALAGELGQLLHVIPGTFDSVDLLCCILLCGASLVVTLRYCDGLRRS